MTVSFIRKSEIDGPIARVPLLKDRWATIDAADLPLVKGWNWFALITKATIYGRRNRLVADGKGAGAILLHRVITAVPDGLVVDHIDGNGLDNRRSNLRIGTQAQNMRNSRMRRNNTSGYKGVFWDNFTGKWMAAIGHNGKFHNLGRFDTREEASVAYAAAAIEKFGEFARLS